MDQRQEWEESLSKFFLSLYNLTTITVYQVSCSHVVCDFSCLGNVESVQSFENSAKNIISFVGIEIGHIRLQFCEDIHFYRKLKIEVGLEGPMVFKNEQSNPSFDVSFLLTESHLLVRVNSFSGEEVNSCLVKIYRESFSRLMKRNIYYPVCNIPCSYE